MAEILDHLIGIIAIFGGFLFLKQQARDNPDFTLFGMRIRQVTILVYLLIGINVIFIVVKLAS